MKQKISWRAE